MIVEEYLFVGSNRPALCRVPHDHRRLIGIVYDSKLVALASLVIDLDRKLLTQPALDAEIELIQVRATQIRVDGEKG